MSKQMTERRPARRRVRGWAEEQSDLVYAIVRLTCALLFRFWIRSYRLIGTQNVPAEGGLFLVANHTTGMDPFLLGAPIKQRKMRGPGKIELFENPVWGWIMRKIGMFPLRQDVADAAAVRTMVELYRKGRLVTVFPEGGRSETGELQPFNPDFARLIIRLKAPLIPAAVAGGPELLPIGKLIPRPHSPVVVVYGEPFELSQYYGRELTRQTAEEAADFMRDRVAALLAVARAERAELTRRT